MTTPDERVDELLGDVKAEIAERFTLASVGPAQTSTRDALTQHSLRLADLLGLAAACGIATLITGATGVLANAGAFVLCALVLLQMFGLYARDAVVIRAGTLDEFPRLAQSVTFAAAVGVLAAPALGSVESAFSAVSWLLACVLLPGARKAGRAIVRSRTKGERVLVLGSGMIADLIASKISMHPEYRHEVIGCLDVSVSDAPAQVNQLPLLGTLDDVERVVADYQVDRVVIAFSAVSHAVLLDAIRRCKRLKLKIGVVPRLFEVIGSRVELHDIGGLTMLGLRGPVRSHGAVAAKRVMDVAGASCALILLCPVLLVIGIVVRVTSPGPAIFRQERIGRHRKPFAMFKFRTMFDGADAQKAEISHLNEFLGGGPMFKIANDPRITRVGHFLRATSLDELPQLVNVLLGEMSIVGPRPLVREESDAILGWHRARLDLTPGLTGPWQVMGRQNVPFDEMVKMDYLYVAEWSLWNDVKLAIRTIPVVLRRTGA